MLWMGGIQKMTLNEISRMVGLIQLTRTKMEELPTTLKLNLVQIEKWWYAGCQKIAFFCNKRSRLIKIQNCL